MSEWHPITDDQHEDGAVIAVEVRDAEGRIGRRVQIVDEEKAERFDAFYDALDAHPAVHILDRAPGWVVFEEAGDSPTDAQRFALHAFDAIEKAREDLTGLTAEEIGCRGNDVHLQPFWRDSASPAPLQALGDYLRQQGATALDDGIDALIDPSPEIRRSARSLLLGASVPSSNALIKTTVVGKGPGSRGAVDSVGARAAVVIPPTQLAKLSPSQLSAAAGLSGLSTSAIEGLQAAGLPLVLGAHRRSAAATQHAKQLQADVHLPAEAALGGGWMRPFFSVALMATAVATAMGAASFGLLGLLTLPLIGALLTLVLASLSGWMMFAWNQDRVLLDQALLSEREAKEERQRQGRDAGLSRAWEELHQARSALAAATHLPSAAASDLRDLLKAAERELSGLSKAQNVVRKGLAASNPASVRARLHKLEGTDPGHEGRRTALQQTLKELEALEARGKAIAEDAHTLESVLSTVAHAIARWETEPEDLAMKAVLGATERARQRRRQVRA